MRLSGVALVAGLLAPSLASAQVAGSSTELPYEVSQPRPPVFGAVVPQPTRSDAHRPAKRTEPTPPRPARLDNGFDESPSFGRMRESGASTITPRPGVDLFRAGPDTYGPSHPVPTPPHNGRRGHGVASPYGHAGAGYAVPYGYGPYAFAPYAPAESSRQVPTDAAGAREVTHGFLRLLINPRSAAVFVDGRYEGTADDFGGSGEHSLPAGPHRVRVEGEGYEPVAFEVRVPENDTITLRRELELRADPPAAAPAPAGPPVARKTLYVIPRCYLGDTPPLPEQLPAGCRIADLRTIPPG